MLSLFLCSIYEEDIVSTLASHPSITLNPFKPSVIFMGHQQTA